MTVLQTALSLPRTKPVNYSLPPKPFNCPNALTVRAEHFTKVHWGVHQDGVVQLFNRPGVAGAVLQTAS